MGNFPFFYDSLPNSEVFLYTSANSELSLYTSANTEAYVRLHFIYLSLYETTYQ